MKTLKQIVVVVTLLLAVLLQSCGNKEKLLVKTWRIEDLQYTKEINPEERSNVDLWVNQMRNAFTLTYNSDGTYATKMGANNLNGTWKMNWNGSVITSTGPDNVPKEFKVLELTETSFKFETLEGKEKVIFVMVPAGNATPGEGDSNDSPAADTAAHS